jgi:hypothetical protein
VSLPLSILVCAIALRFLLNACLECLVEFVAMLVSVFADFFSECIKGV